MARRVRAPAVAGRSKVARVMAAWREKAKRDQPPPPELFEEAIQRAFVTSLIAGDKPKMETGRKKGPLRKRQAASQKKVSSPKNTSRRKQRR